MRVLIIYAGDGLIREPIGQSPKQMLFLRGAKDKEGFLRLPKSRTCCLSVLRNQKGFHDSNRVFIHSPLGIQLGVKPLFI